MRALVAATAIAASLAAAGPAPGATWERLDTMASPPARSDHALAGADGRAYLFGGRGPSGLLADLWVLRSDGPRPSWRRLSPRGARPAARFGHNLEVTATGEVLLFGGQGSRFFNDLWRYSPRANRWTRLRGRRPTPRYGAAGALHRGALVISHGFTTRGRFDDTWALRSRDGRARNLSPRRRPIPRCLMSGAAYRGRFFLFGGQANTRRFLGDLWRLDLRRRTWRRIGGRAPSPRNLYGAARDRSHWYVHGGATPGGAAGDLWRLDMRAGRFRQIDPRGSGPSARSSHALGTVGAGRIVLFGGAGAGGGELADTWLLTVD